jgi:hypothetical protein
MQWMRLPLPPPAPPTLYPVYGVRIPADGMDPADSLSVVETLWASV